MYKSFVVRIYPDEVQESFFINQFGCCRFVFNTFLDAKKTVYSDSGKYVALRNVVECFLVFSGGFG